MGDFICCYDCLNGIRKLLYVVVMVLSFVPSIAVLCLETMVIDLFLLHGLSFSFLYVPINNKQIYIYIFFYKCCIL